MNEPDPSLFLSPIERRDESAPPSDDAGHAPAGRAEVVAADEVGGDGGRRRRVGAVAVVVVLALVVLGVNRMAATDDPSAPAADDGAGEAEEDAQASTTTERRRPPTTRPTGATPTTLPPTLQTFAVLGSLLPDVTGTTVVLASNGQLVVAHLDSGTVRAVGISGMEVYGGYPFQAVLPVGDAFLTSGPRPSLVPRASGGEVAAGDVPVFGGYLPSGVEGRFWTVDHRFQMELVERSLDEETGRRIELPGESGVVLPLADSFIVSPFGSVMQVDAETGRARRIAEGTAVAANEETLARVRCDESLDCGLVLTDLDGGRERIVPPPTPRSRYETYSGVRFSPDGRWLVSPFYGEDQPGGLVLVDVERGERRFLDSLATSSGGGFPQSAVFTADSRWLLFADPSTDGQPIKAIRIEDGAIAEIDLGLDAPLDRQQGVVLLALPSIPADADPAG